MSLLHGNLYRCPFSANGTNLGAIPFDTNDIVDITDENVSIQELKKSIIDLYQNKQYLTACSYCYGRDYSSTTIPAALQVKRPLEYKKINTTFTIN